MLRVLTAPPLTGASATQPAVPSEPRIPGALQRIVALFLVTFLLVFPKGGIKVAGVPVTWGYLGLGLLCAALPVVALLRGAFGRIRVVRPLVVALLIPFVLLGAGSFVLNGTASVGFAISFLVTFGFLPLALVGILGPSLDRLDLTHLFRAIRIGVLTVAVYGIVLFVYKLVTGTFIEIPYLTVNAGDAGSLETEKYINRGGVFKLISTYNNGNIYGVCLVMLLPLYAWLEPGPVRQGIVKLSLLLTLSRTVWAGLVAYELLQRVYVKRITWRTALTLAASLVLVVTGVAYALNLLRVDAMFLLDRRLGGRFGQLRALERATILPQREFEGIQEIVYLSVLDNFGLLGLVLFVAGMVFPIILYLLRCLPAAHPELKRALVAGLVIYLFVSVSDGAILFIPTMAFYWFLVSLLVADDRGIRRPDRRATRPTPVAPSEASEPRPWLATVRPARA